MHQFTSFIAFVIVVHLLKSRCCPLKGVARVMVSQKRVGSICYYNCLKSIGLRIKTVLRQLQVITLSFAD